MCIDSSYDALAWHSSLSISDFHTMYILIPYIPPPPLTLSSPPPRTSSSLYRYQGSHFYLIEPACKLAFTSQIKAIVAEPQTVYQQVRGGCVLSWCYSMLYVVAVLL